MSGTEPNPLNATNSSRVRERQKFLCAAISSDDAASSRMATMSWYLSATALILQLAIPECLSIGPPDDQSSLNTKDALKAKPNASPRRGGELKTILEIAAVTNQPHRFDATLKQVRRSLQTTRAPNLPRSSATTDLVLHNLHAIASGFL